MAKAIEVDGLTKFYGDLLAVDHISFAVEEGELFGFLGPNGAGKTTTVRMLSGLTRISEGEARVGGFDVRRQAKEVKAHIGVVQDTSNLYLDLSVYDNLMFAAQIHGVPRRQRHKRVMELLEMFGLASRKDQRFAALSRGLKRRLTIAAALVHEPPILFLDEPTLGLDVKSRRLMHRLIKELHARGTTIFLTTHYIEEADRLCDRIAIINRGRIILVDTPEGIKRRAQGEQAVRVSFEGGGERLAEQLKGLPQVEDVEVTSDGFELRSERISEVLLELADFARSRGLRISSLHTTGPTLEDAFAQLTGIDLELMRMERKNAG